MSLGRDDATRVLRFCLAGDGWGSAITEDGMCVVRVARAGGGGTEVRRFEGATFEEALRQAAALGALKTSCVDKQIAFLARSLPEPKPGVPGGGNGAPGSEGGESTEKKESRSGQVTSALLPTIATTLSALIHEVQRERGRSALYVSSVGRLFGREMVEQWRLTDERRAELASLRERHGGRLPESAGQRMENADAILGKLIPARKRVEALEMAAPRIIEAYTAVNIELLGVADVLASEGVERPLRPAALAYMALLYAKEKVGIERAELATTFADDRCSDDQRRIVATLISARRSYLHMFSAAAPRRVVRLLERSMASDVVTALEQMEQLPLTRPAGFGVDPVDWFTTATRQMDLLSDIETALLSSL